MTNETITLRTFFPLLWLFTIVGALTLSVHAVFGLTIYSAMTYFMGFYFLVFGALKVLNWKDFVRAYSKYDALARRSKVYAQAYPFIEVSLGVLFIFQWYLLFASVVTFVLMSQKALSVYLKIRSGNSVVCACLGGFFAIPITWVTFLEDALMAVMGFLMIFHFL